MGLQFLKLEQVTRVQSFGNKILFSAFLGRNVTDFDLPKCKLEHEVKENMSTAYTFFCRPYFHDGRMVLNLA